MLLFFYLIRIVENINSDICVIDRIGMNNGKLVVIFFIGKFKFYYKGNGFN